MKQSDDSYSRKKVIEQRDVSFSSDIKSALLESKTPYANAVLYIVAVFILIAIIWASFATLDEVTTGAGKVIPSSQVKKIQNLEGGILKKITVHEGQVLKAGQVVTILDDTRFAAEYQEQQKRYMTLQLELARFRAEANGDAQIRFPNLLLKDMDQVKRSQEKLFKQRKETYQQKLATLRSSYAIFQKELKITQPLVNKGVMSKIDLLKLQQNINETSGKIKEMQHRFREDARASMSKVHSEVVGLKEKMHSLKDKMTRTTIRSPVRGIVKQINVNTIGAVVKSAEVIMEIVPLEDSLLVEAKVSPKDIAFIHPGQQATVKLTAYDYSIYGGLKGVVTHISADTSKDDQGKSYFEVWVRTKKNFLGTAEKRLPIIPGMTASIHVLTGHKTVMDYLLKPLLKAKHNALQER